MRHFKKFEHKKSGHFKEKHVTCLKTRNEPKMKIFDFGAFQNKMHMASREKYIFHILFGAFHGTPRTKTKKSLYDSVRKKSLPELPLTEMN